MKLPLVTVVLDTVLCVIDALKKNRFLPGLFRSRAGALVYDHGGVVGGGGLFRSVSVPPAASSAACAAAPGPVPLSGSYDTHCLSYFIVACLAKIPRILPNIFPVF